MQPGKHDHRRIGMGLPLIQQAADALIAAPLAAVKGAPRLLVTATTVPAVVAADIKARLKWLARELDEAPATDAPAGAVGTLGWMSPEQRAGAPVDARADVWALGQVLRAILCGRCPPGDDLPDAAPPDLAAIARRAIERKTGARGLRSIMESILLETMFDLPAMTGVEEVVISKDVVDGTAKPLLIYADKQNGKATATA